jgi:hypothetical protein
MSTRYLVKATWGQHSITFKFADVDGDGSNAGVFNRMTQQAAKAFSAELPAAIYIEAEEI